MERNEKGTIYKVSGLCVCVCEREYVHYINKIYQKKLKLYVTQIK